MSDKNGAATAVLMIGDSRAEVHYHRSKDGQIVVDRIYNIDHGIPIKCTTSGGYGAGSTFPEMAQQCAALIEAEALAAAAA